MKSLEKTNNNIWIITGPAAVGKNYSVLEPLEKLNIPNLVVQDMDRLKDHYRRYAAIGKNGRVLATTQDHIDAFFKQNKGKDIVLGGVGWMPREDPLKFPEESKLIYLYRDPKVIAKDKYKRDFDGKDVDVSAQAGSWTPKAKCKLWCHFNRGRVFADEKSFIADIEKEIVEEFALYEERGWTRAAADQVVKDIASNYQQGEA